MLHCYVILVKQVGHVNEQSGHTCSGSEVTSKDISHGGWRVIRVTCKRHSYTQLKHSISGVCTVHDIPQSSSNFCHVIQVVT